MAWTTEYNGVKFANEDGTSLYKVAESCIEAAEQIIRCFAAGRTTRARAQGTVHAVNQVQAAFAAGNTVINVTAGDILAAKPPTGDYNFAALPDGLPGLGQGIVLLRKGRGDQNPFNMHFGAVVGVDGARRLISDVSQRDQDPALVAPTFVEITRIDDFRGHDYPAARFAAGLLSV